MDKDTTEMLKKVFIYDIIILAIALTISLLFFPKYAVVIIVGLTISEINFIINALITSHTMKNNGNPMLHVIGAVVRVAITVAVVAALFGDDIYNLVAFLTGYTLHYLVIVFYGVTRVKNKERK